VQIVGPAGNSTRQNRVIESTGGDADRRWKNYSSGAGHCFEAAARTFISSKNGTLDLSVILLRVE
jgi:hypothetical protein